MYVLDEDNLYILREYAHAKEMDRREGGKTKDSDWERLRMTGTEFMKQFGGGGRGVGGGGGLSLIHISEPTRPP